MAVATLAMISSPESQPQPRMRLRPRLIKPPMLAPEPSPMLAPKPSPKPAPKPRRSEAQTLTRGLRGVIHESSHTQPRARVATRQRLERKSGTMTRANHKTKASWVDLWAYSQGGIEAVEVSDARTRAPPRARVHSFTHASRRPVGLVGSARA